MKVVSGMLVLCIFFSQILCAQIIPANRRVDWTLAGLRQPKPVYTRVVDITTFGGVGNGLVPTDLALQAAIASFGSDSGIVSFPPGTYLFISPINLRSGLVLRGQDALTSTLLFNLQFGVDLINILGTSTGTVSPLTLPAFKDERSVRVSNPGSFAAGDYVKLFQNDSALVLDVFNCVGQILLIQNITGDTITFASPLRRNYDMVDLPAIRLLNIVTGVGIECLKIKRIDSVNLASNIVINYAARCWVKGVESDSTNFAHVSINNATNVEVTGCYFHGAFGYGPGGMGYGVAVNVTSGECLVEDNIFRHLRHSMLVQSGANGNVFTLNYSREPFKSENQPFDLSGDMVLHGNYPYANLFEGNIGQNIVVDFSHFINGPLNTFFRNRAELYGILFSTHSGDSSNVVGNEATGLQGRYIVSGVGHFQYANNVSGTILPAGTTTLTDSSYYYTGEPPFWHLSFPYPSIGIPYAINTRTIPAKARYDAGTNLTVCPPNSVLALHTFLFTVEKKQTANVLTWQVNYNHETNIFELERSIDGINFALYATVRGVESAISYSHLDYNLSNETVYYRIRQVMKSGKIFNSTIVLITNAKATIRIYPNPAKSFFTVESKDLQTLQVIDYLGHVLLQRTHISAQQMIDTKQLAVGIYVVKCVDNNGQVFIRKLVVE